MMRNNKSRSWVLHLGQYILKFYRPISFILYAIGIVNIIINIVNNTNMEGIILSITGIAVVYFLKEVLEEALESQP